MPDCPSWIDRVPDILAHLENPNCAPFLDRAAIESLFHLRRRQAIALMHQVKGYRLAKALVVDRSALLRSLRTRLPRSRQEQERKQSVLEALGSARREFAESARQRALPIPAITLRPDIHERQLSGLTAGIQLAPGRLTITFDAPEELLQKLFELGQALANDYETFAAAVQLRSGKEREPEYVEPSW